VKHLFLLILSLLATTPCLADVNFTGDEREDPRRPGMVGTWTRSSNLPGFAFGPGGNFGIVVVPDVAEPILVVPSVPEEAPAEVKELAIEVAKDLGKINFAFDSSVVEEQYTELLDKVAGTLLDHPEIGVTLDGHTDRMGSDDYNQALGLRRSVAIQSELHQRGVPAEQLQVVSFGESNPLVDVFTPERENRRVEVHTDVEAPSTPE
jgi:outer membrane protein OmpA-like peptidoglycan-associated protein